MEATNKITIEIDKDLDLLTAFVNDKSSDNSLESIDYDNIIFFVEHDSKKLIMIQVYDFSIFKKKMLSKFLQLKSNKSINVWLYFLVNSFQAAQQTLSNFNHLKDSNLDSEIESNIVKIPITQQELQNLDIPTVQRRHLLEDDDVKKIRTRNEELNLEEFDFESDELKIMKEDKPTKKSKKK